MSAISLSSFSFRSSQGAAAQSRGNTYGAYNNSARSSSTARSTSTTVASRTSGIATTGRTNTLSSAGRTSTPNTAANSSVYNRSASSANSSTYCPTCGGQVSRSASPGSSSYCPTCNTAGGTQSNIAASRATVTSTTDHAHTYGQGGRVCVTCGYQAR